jgi:hypothetical protein
MAAVMAKLKCEKPRDLARKLGIDRTDGERKVSRWVNGENAPNFYMTLRLLDLAGWLKIGALDELRLQLEARRDGGLLDIQEIRELLHRLGGV